MFSKVSWTLYSMNMKRKNVKIIREKRRVNFKWYIPFRNLRHVQSWELVRRCVIIRVIFIEKMNVVHPFVLK